MTENRKVLSGEGQRGWVSDGNVVGAEAGEDQILLISGGATGAL